MPYLALCRDDPLLNLIHDTFGASLIRVPDSRVQPLTVVAQRGRRACFRGTLAPLVAGPPLPELPLIHSQLADIAGRRSRWLKLDLGLALLSGLLGGLGLPAAGVGTALQGVRALAFAFPEVERTAVDINELGRTLTGRTLDSANPAAAVFLREPRHRLLVIDAVLISSGVVVHLARSRDQSLNINLAGLEALTSGVSGRIGLRPGSSDQLLIEGARGVPFAFSCVRLDFDADGRIGGMPPDTGRRTLGDDDYGLVPARLDEQPGLVVWDS